MNYLPDSVGRINAIQNGTTLQPFASNITYTAAGGISSLVLGNSVTEQVSWNDRQQLTGITEAPQSGANLLTLSLYPCAGQATSCSSGNTGSVQQQTIGMPGLSLTQTYTYDTLNRLQTATEGSNWSQTWLYGNGNAYLSAYSGFTPQPFTPTASTAFNGQNQLQIQGSHYDSAGNQAQIGALPSSFDGEGRLLSTSVNNATINYIYDGEGQRVSKQTVVGGTVTDTTLYVYDADGNLDAEYDTSPAGSACGTPTCYLSVDHLGSTRLLMDSAGNAARRYDYYPFGAEIPSGVAGRTTALGYQASADGFNPKFSGMVRDMFPSGTPTGLDYFNARYYSPDQARFVSPDPENAGADITDPRTWNGYAYVSNNPLSYTDPNGLGIFGDIGSIIGSFFPGLGTLIGWGIGSIADLATGQSISPPGIGIGTDIIGGIAGSVNSGQPWNEQLPIGGVGSLNTGTVFGSGDAGPFINNFENGNVVYDWGVRFQAWAYSLTPFPIYSRRTGARIRNARRGGSRSADFVSLSVSVGPWYGGQGSLSLDRYCRAYVGFGPQVGKSPTLVSGSLTGNWLDQRQKPTPGELDNYLSAHNVAGTAGFGVGAQQGWWPGSGGATGIGIVTPQAGVGYTYSFPLGRVCGGWR